MAPHTVLAKPICVSNSEAQANNESNKKNFKDHFIMCARLKQLQLLTLGNQSKFSKRLDLLNLFKMLNACNQQRKIAPSTRVVINERQNIPIIHITHIGPDAHLRAKSEPTPESANRIENATCFCIQTNVLHYVCKGEKIEHIQIQVQATT